MTCSLIKCGSSYPNLSDFEPGVYYVRSGPCSFNTIETITADATPVERTISLQCYHLMALTDNFKLAVHVYRTLGSFNVIYTMSVDAAEVHAIVSSERVGAIVILYDIEHAVFIWSGFHNFDSLETTKAQVEPSVSLEDYFLDTQSISISSRDSCRSQS